MRATRAPACTGPSSPAHRPLSPAPALSRVGTWVPTRPGPVHWAPGGRHGERRVALADTEESSTTHPQREPAERGKTVHGEAANAGHRVLAPDDAEVEAYLETALKAPGARPLAPTTGPAAPSEPPRRPGRRPRLRQPVRPADRPPRARARRLLGAPAARHAVRRARAARRPGDHPVGRPELGLRRRRARAGPGHLVRPDPGPRASATARS